MSDTRTAFSRGGLLCFGIETLLRGPALVRRVLAILLLGWTILLALPGAAHWLRHQRGSGLGQLRYHTGHLAARPELPLARAARRSTRDRRRVDAVLTLGQAIIHNLRAATASSTSPSRSCHRRTRPCCGMPACVVRSGRHARTFPLSSPSRYDRDTVYFTNRSDGTLRSALR